ncbi:hypothetical protein [Desulfoscipio sp. XC116]|uniref:hypothetical protein n=1 Tax=Desulfoscipio sp. XC116 TaxID=3144975 RepID=UPI00325B46C5
MSELDTLIKEKLVPMRKRILDSLIQKHPHIFGMLNNCFLDKRNKVGMQVTENGTVIGEYTFILNGLDIGDVQIGMAASEIHHPMGVIKPYAIVEKRALEEMLNDEQKFTAEPFAALQKYMPDITIKFLR